MGKKYILNKLGATPSSLKKLRASFERDSYVDVGVRCVTGEIKKRKTERERE